jgi:L-threonylcarbamoyladenylate synthase
MNARHPTIIDAQHGARESAVADAAARLHAGALAIVPTDTVYGVAAHPGCPQAVERLFTIKGRDRTKPIPFLIASLDDARRYGAQFSPLAATLAARFWPGALTLVLPMENAPGVEEGFRVPDSAVARALIRAAGGILRVTSANQSGEAPALTAAEAMRALGDTIDLVFDDGPAPIGVASTVVRVAGSQARILRLGALSAQALRDAGADLPDTAA